MFLFRKPSSEKIREFLAAQARLDLTYTAVGATAWLRREPHSRQTRCRREGLAGSEDSP
jgi:hypothetical protein